MKYLNPDVQKNICLYLKTKTEALDVLEKLEDIVSKFDSEDLSGAVFYEKFTQDLNLREKEIITFLIDEVLDGKLGKSDLNEISKEFSEFIKDVEVMHIGITFLPSERFVKKIFDWLNKNFTPNDIFLIQIDHQEDIFAGLKMSYKGKYYDLSLDKKIEAFLNDYQFAKVD